MNADGWRKLIFITGTYENCPLPLKSLWTQILTQAHFSSCLILPSMDSAKIFLVVLSRGRYSGMLWRHDSSYCLAVWKKLCFISSLILVLNIGFSMQTLPWSCFVAHPPFANLYFRWLSLVFVWPVSCRNKYNWEDHSGDLQGDIWPFEGYVLGGKCCKKNEKLSLPYSSECLW